LKIEQNTTLIFREFLFFLFYIMRDVELKKAFRGDTCSSLNIKVTNATGKEFELCLCPSQSVQCLKEEISGENPKDGVHYKLLSMNSNRILDEKKTLAEEGIKDNGWCE
jgi:hypothetical protein